MSLYRVGKVWYVDWERARLGQIRRSTGETKRPAAERIHAMLGELEHEERWDLLADIRTGKLPLRQVYDAYRKGTLKALPNADAMRRVDALLPGWADGARSVHTADGRRHVGRRILALKKDATLNDLPDLVGLLRARLLGRPRSFNAILMTCRALLRDACGERSALYERLAAVKALPYTAKRVHPFTRGEIRAVMDWLGPVRGRMLWTLCLTGMRPGEYWGRWEVDGGLIRVHGTKTKGSDRIVPLIEEPVRPECSYHAFRQHLAQYPEGRVRVYRSRHTYAHWLERARVPRTRLRLYMGHSSRDITDEYLWHEVVAFTRKDAERVRAFLAGGRLAIAKGVA